MAKLKIYIVEDSAVIRENLIDALHESAPIEIAGCADDERGAVSWLRDPGNDCDLVIVDIFLKGGSGLGVLKALDADPAAPPRIVLSNHATPEVRVKCQELGAAQVFDKSNELDEMLAWLSRFARSGRGAAASHS
jgi:DNA-binding NarL/FixJ family response regulator